MQLPPGSHLSPSTLLPWEGNTGGPWHQAVRRSCPWPSPQASQTFPKHCSSAWPLGPGISSLFCLASQKPVPFPILPIAEGKRVQGQGGLHWYKECLCKQKSKRETSTVTYLCLTSFYPTSSRAVLAYQV